jgi:hypothetical protein
MHGAHAVRCLLSALVAALELLALTSAHARPRSEARYAYITVESRYGAGVVTGPVRQGPSGRLEVRLPGGTWLECGQSCHETLRRETVDFWQERGHPKGGGDGPGYLRFRF